MAEQEVISVEQHKNTVQLHLDVIEDLKDQINTLVDQKATQVALHKQTKRQLEELRQHMETVPEKPKE